MREEQPVLGFTEMGHLYKQILLCLCYPIRKKAHHNYPGDIVLNLGNPSGKNTIVS